MFKQFLSACALFLVTAMAVVPVHAEESNLESLFLPGVSISVFDEKGYFFLGDKILGTGGFVLYMDEPSGLLEEFILWNKALGVLSNSGSEFSATFKLTMKHIPLVTVALDESGCFTDVSVAWGAVNIVVVEQITSPTSISGVTDPTVLFTKDLFCS